MEEYQKQLQLQREKLVELMGVKEKFLKQSKAPSWAQEQIRLKFDARINRALYENR